MRSPLPCRSVERWHEKVDEQLPDDTVPDVVLGLRNRPSTGILLESYSHRLMNVRVNEGFLTYLLPYRPARSAVCLRPPSLR